MAKRPIFIPLINKGELFKEVDIDFKFYTGFAVSQKTKSINSLHESAREDGFSNVLEVSTKSDSLLGQRLSAFNLMLDTDDYGQISIEAAFQGSKVFEKGGPYTDIYYKDPVRAKKDIRIKESGNLKAFEFEGQTWGLEPKSAFYDWIYCKALQPQKEYLLKTLTKYDAFSDIEFNPKKSINCQARTCAILVALMQLDLFDKALTSPDAFIDIVYKKNIVQATLF